MIIVRVSNVLQQLKYLLVAGLLFNFTCVEIAQISYAKVSNEGAR